MESYMKMQPFFATLMIVFGAIFGIIANNQYLVSIQATVSGDPAILYRAIFFGAMCFVGFVWLIIITFLEEINQNK